MKTPSKINMILRHHQTTRRKREMITSRLSTKKKYTQRSRQQTRERSRLRKKDHIQQLTKLLLLILKLKLISKKLVILIKPLNRRPILRSLNSSLKHRDQLKSLNITLMTTKKVLTRSTLLFYMGKRLTVRTGRRKLFLILSLTRLSTMKRRSLKSHHHQEWNRNLLERRSS